MVQTSLRRVAVLSKEHIVELRGPIYLERDQDLMFRGEVTVQELHTGESQAGKYEERVGVGNMRWSYDDVVPRGERGRDDVQQVLDLQRNLPEALLERPCVEYYDWA